MSHFYAAIPTSTRKHAPIARGHKSTGIAAYVASRQGRVRVYMWYDEASGKDHYEVHEQPHEGRGCNKLLASGIVGEDE